MTGELVAYKQKMSISSLSDYEQLETLSAKGSKNKVKVVRARREGSIVCVKSFTSGKFSVVQEALNEAKLLLAASSRHGNICEMFDCFVEQIAEKFCFSIIMENFSSGDLEDEIRRRKASDHRWREDQLFTIFEGLISALSTLQKNSICHRDIKPQNIFMAGELQFKLGDFGVSMYDHYATRTRTLAGTPMYFSPLCAKAYRNLELSGSDLGVRHDVYKSDVFSLGLTFLRMACLVSVRGLNLLGQERLSQVLAQANCGDQVKRLLNCMLRVEEIERPDFLTLENIFKEIRRPIIPRYIQPVFVEVAVSEVQVQDVQVQQKPPPTCELPLPENWVSFSKPTDLVLTLDDYETLDTESEEEKNEDTVFQLILEAIGEDCREIKPGYDSYGSLAPN